MDNELWLDELTGEWAGRDASGRVHYHPERAGVYRAIAEANRVMADHLARNPGETMPGACAGNICDDCQPCAAGDIGSEREMELAGAYSPRQGGW
jgi:hypothetical protein